MATSDPETLYEKQERIGKGSFGEVFKGISRKTKKSVAIKIIDLEDAEDEMQTDPMDVDNDDVMSYLEAQESIRKLKANAIKLGVPPKSTIHLERFAKALRQARAEKRKKDATLHSFFNKN